MEFEPCHVNRPAAISRPAQRMTEKATMRARASLKTLIMAGTMTFHSRVFPHLFALFLLFSIFDSHSPVHASISRNFYLLQRRNPRIDQLLFDPESQSSKRAQSVRCFFTLLAICHTVLVDASSKEKAQSASDNIQASSRPHLSYKAQSPDEACLVSLAAHSGFVFKGREFHGDQNEIVLQALGVDERYLIYNVIEFDSDRKRMSVIVRKPSGEVVLFCKGADSVIFERLGPNQEQIIESTTSNLESFAQEGLWLQSILCGIGCVVVICHSLLHHAPPLPLNSALFACQRC